MIGERDLAPGLLEPVEHVREIRSLFLLKLVVLVRAGLDRTPLLEAQRAVVLPSVATPEARLRASTGTERVFVRFRLETTRAAVDCIDRVLADRPGGIGTAPASSAEPG